MYLDHYLLQFTGKVDQILISWSWESVRTLLKIIHLASKKSYLVIICPNSHERLTKIKIRSRWSVRTLLRMTHLAHRKSYLVIICHNSLEMLTKSEIRWLLFALIWFYLLLFCPKIQFMSIFSLAYRYLPLFTFI